VAGGQCRGILGIVKPEAQMERVRRSQAHIGVETKDIVQKNGLDLNVAVRLLKSSSAAALSPLSAAPMSKEIVDPTRHTPAGESPLVALSVAHLAVTTKVSISSIASRNVCILSFSDLRPQVLV